ncbi:uncharacterized protein [Physcomitrium patens]|uniref:Large ribosomal subunit protein bL32m n=1 Tax=Physcomitrium patens TaxID=3218 RepID=A0A2K1LAL0_PHYPA|nr:uncharacterized protein LOC112288442 [Physcomitrium patens]PNR63062.1 hypothetical protein PHYPA_001487 [Physcomitrium patens]|eukprot:XP_024388411.1 uncharacterized protein LOC112288442 [Physcomitrella patens]
MLRALRSVGGRLVNSWTVCRSSFSLNSRTCSSLAGAQNVGSSSMMPQSPAWVEWNSGMELPEAVDDVVGDMELMAVPKRKVTPSRKGKRNGGKILKSVPVIAKCKVCGRIKLPHLYCCDGQVKG